MATEQFEGVMVFKEQNVYGQLLKFPMNPLAKFVCRLTGTKTITYSTQQLCEHVGLTVLSEEESLLQKIAVLEKAQGGK